MSADSGYVLIQTRNILDSNKLRLQCGWTCFYCIASPYELPQGTITPLIGMRSHSRYDAKTLLNKVVCHFLTWGISHRTRSSQTLFRACNYSVQSMCRQILSENATPLVRQNHEGPKCQIGRIR